MIEFLSENYFDFCLVCFEQRDHEALFKEG